MSGMLHASVVRSDRAHARILGIDTAEALAATDVVAVVTAADLEPLFPRFGHIIADHYILAPDKVRYFGEPVAIVLAETRGAAADAARLVQVDYEDLSSVMTATEAVAPGAPLVHEQSYDATGDDSFKNLTGKKHSMEFPEAEGRRTNVAHEVDLEWGDVDAARGSAHLVVESTVQFPMLYAY